jgi:hypothetical protein
MSFRLYPCQDDKVLLTCKFPQTHRDDDDEDEDDEDGIQTFNQK